MAWYDRVAQGIQTETSEKKEAPDGLWIKCPSCSNIDTMEVLQVNFHVCPHCEYHFRINSKDYFEIIFNDDFEEIHNNLISKDFLGFEDKKQYKDRIVQAQNKTKLDDSIKSVYGKIGSQGLVVACMDFTFIGGSMGSVVGEKIVRSIKTAIDLKVPFLMISKSGGARMQESAYSLMQMAKTSAMLNLLSKAKLPYLSLLTDPTTGGVTASYAMLGDLNISEPGALIGFAGPRVIKETIKRDLPEGFQTSEFLLEKGFLDFIVHRKDLRQRLLDLIGLFNN
jgi:acetyl-CoA carboxylase carboxyl transferase subunit beta